MADAVTPAGRRLEISPETPVEDATRIVREWLESNVPREWLEAGREGGTWAIRQARTRSDYEAWYPVFAISGLVVPTWPVDYGGLGVSPLVARRIEAELRPFNLGRLNPLGLNLAAPALFAHGTEQQRVRFLPPIVNNTEKWCQLFSEPGSGSDLASLSTRAISDGDEWVVKGQKVWTTWAHVSDFGVLLARTDPGAPKRRGMTYFLIELHQPGVDVRPLRHMGGEVEFNEVFLDGARVPDSQRVGEIGKGWEVAAATLSGERQMVAGSGSGGVDRIGGSGASRLIALARQVSYEGRPGGWDERVRRDEIMQLWCEERVREWTNLRVRAQLSAGKSPGPESSIGKVHQGSLNQRIQLMATDLLGPASTAWPNCSDRYEKDLPFEVKGMLRSRANTIEGGTTEVNKNILGERVLGLPREPDPWDGRPWLEVPTRPMTYQTLSLERAGPVGWLIFNRPEVGNAMDARMLDELEDTWRELDDDPEIRVIVNTGAGSAFQTGLDVGQLAKDPEALRKQSRRTRRAELRLTAWHNQVFKPVVAAVNGTCAGGGLHFVADADVVIASSDATFLDAHVSVGQVAAYEMIGLARKMPFESVMRMALVGRHERMSAQRAMDLGMVSQVVDPPERLREEAQSLGEKIARNSPAAMRATKRALWGALETGLTDACRAGAIELVSLWGHPDQEEGPRAFAEKREPVWAPLAAQGDVSS